MVSISDLTATFQKDFHLSDRIDLLSKTVFKPNLSVKVEFFVEIHFVENHLFI